MKSIKCLLVGDGNVGKSSLLMRFTTDVFPGDYIPTIFDSYSSNLTVDNTVFNLTLWDTAGQEENRAHGLASLPQTDVVILCFSLVHPPSFQNIQPKWNREVKRRYPDAPVVLVGTKLDLKTDKATVKRMLQQNASPIPYPKGLTLASKIGATAYVECSALTREGVKSVFEQVVQAATGPKPKAKDNGSKVAALGMSYSPI